MKQYKPLVLKKILAKIQHPLRGLKVAFLTENILRFEIIMLVILIPLAFILGPNALSQVLLISSWLLVIMMELINTAIETMIDRIGLDHHKLSQKAKDIGSAVVLISGLNAAFTWLLFFIKLFLK